MRIGIDIGSTTIKCVALDRQNRILYRHYERHYSQIAAKTAELLRTVRDGVAGGHSAQVALSGSAGMGMAHACGIPFVQEVFATRIALRDRLPQTDVAIELGGEDAKILFLTGGQEVRMNGTCAGGTGAFIDQMATLLDITPEEMNERAKGAQQTYVIASRCGVFAKSDVQPLINQGARIEDISASIFAAVVNQSIAGLAQGRPIQGNITYLGGPLTFLTELRSSFDRALGLTGTCPGDSLYYVALGAALSAREEQDLGALIEQVAHYRGSGQGQALAPLFAQQADFEAFRQRHQATSAPAGDPGAYTGPAYLGVDAGSTTIKMAVVGDSGELLASRYLPNKGNPIPLVREFLADFYRDYPQISLAGSAATGYGEDLVKNAFCLDLGIVETMAHLTAARAFMPEVDFIIDIGGQDMKCMRVRNGVIDDIFLNEACSSGCGSFLQTFANALGYDIADFAKLGLFARHPVDLGSRCTVFMNSSVKQAQKEGASIKDISAGLSISVVKNALYKVIRASSAQALGQHIVVQGGTFLNDAVLRAFEQELGAPVIRPAIAELMGAYGAALYARDHAPAHTSLLGPEALARFTHEVRDARCNQCSNHCRLTVNLFDGGRRFISGNRCERPVAGKQAENALNLYADKLDMLLAYRPQPGPLGRIGLPLALNLYELLPFWHRLFTELGFEVVVSPPSSRELYLQGQGTIPSDTVCFPAKLVHGHVQYLLEAGVDAIFYPCLTYNLDEGISDNHYNCPIVAYYPEVIRTNVPDLDRVAFFGGYVGLHKRRMLPAKLLEMLQPRYPSLTLPQLKRAVDAGFREYAGYLERVRARGDAIIAEARSRGMPIVVLAGRPYHIDPEINHGIDRLIAGYGCAVVSEEAVSAKERRPQTRVLNQWTYHARLFAAARYVRQHPDMQLVQLTSFGCGIDAITTDEVRDILSPGIYTLLKIDEVTNLGIVRIRMRSLLAALEGGRERVSS